jgi:hypothetical protein
MTDDRRLDGNAIAGDLMELFGAELTIAVAVCRACGARLNFLAVLVLSFLEYYPVLLTTAGPGAERGLPDRRPPPPQYNSAMALAAGVLVFGLLVLWALSLKRSP